MITASVLSLILPLTAADQVTYDCTIPFIRMAPGGGWAAILTK